MCLNQSRETTCIGKVLLPPSPYVSSHAALALRRVQAVADSLVCICLAVDERHHHTISAQAVATQQQQEQEQELSLASHDPGVQCMAWLQW